MLKNSNKQPSKKTKAVPLQKVGGSLQSRKTEQGSKTN